MRSDVRALGGSTVVASIILPTFWSEHKPSPIYPKLKHSQESPHKLTLPAELRLFVQPMEEPMRGDGIADLDRLAWAGDLLLT